MTSGMGLKDVIEIVGKLQNYVNINSNEINFNNATDLTTKFINVFNNLINQNMAWSNVTDGEKTDISSSVLMNIQFSAFILSYNLNKTKNSRQISEPVFTANIIVNTYLTDFSESFDFEANGSSITIPKGLSFDQKDISNK